MQSPILLRLARQLHAVYEHRDALAEQERQAAWTKLEIKYEQVQRCWRLVDKARSRGWLLAVRSQKALLPALLRTFSSAASDLCQLGGDQTLPLLQVEALLRELEALHDEFGEVSVDLKKKCLAAHTDAITLEEVNLGRFSIELHWQRLALRSGAACFEVIALDPNPADGNRDVTHPHVQREQLCAGDATVPLHKALQKGRLVDAFVLIRSVLQTYNPDSAYFALGNWGGTTCWDCGDSMNEDERWCCEGCDRDTCSSCVSSCTHCDQWRCVSCQTTCDHCGQSCCSSCLSTPGDSTQSLCPSCVENRSGDMGGTTPIGAANATPLHPTAKHSHSKEIRHECDS
jgi:hypothetical protein